MRCALKRTLDVAGAAILLALASPLLVLAALLVRASSGSPILFRQKRIGRSGRLFELLKFRTMTASSGAGSEQLPDEHRLTAVGRFLRAASIDELPQLVNVLRGDMSLVGPRPLLPEYLSRYSREQARRHEVKPGLTGWAQVHGRNILTWEEKFKLDVWYVDHASAWLDFKILLKTAVMVFRREGISASGHATMPPFEGSHEGGGLRS
jgi:lipopolysaccharide/colanic/teichoic acid biosynthesis glycosyltransferase